jgi:DNA-binding NarL/FixJ family response regulator
VSRARIVVADDHEGIRETVLRLLKRDFDVLESVDNGLAALEAVRRLEPDVCVMDVSMPFMSGFEAASRLKQSGSFAKVIFLSIHGNSDFVQTALTKGAAGYVVKARMSEDLVTAIKEALAGRTFVSAVDS